MRTEKTQRFIIGGVIALASVSFAAAALAQSASRTIWDGVYTSEQATRGQAVYAARCAACHGASLSGVDSAPALSGAPFLNNWNGTTAADLFSRIDETMPVDEPGALTNRQTADVVAFILQTNAAPAGSTALASNPQLLAGTTIVAQRPRR